MSKLNKIKKEQLIKLVEELHQTAGLEIDRLLKKRYFGQLFDLEIDTVWLKNQLRIALDKLDQLESLIEEKAPEILEEADFPDFWPRIRG